MLTTLERVVRNGYSNEIRRNIVNLIFTGVGTD